MTVQRHQLDTNRHNIAHVFARGTLFGALPHDPDDTTPCLPARATHLPLDLNTFWLHRADDITDHAAAANRFQCLCGKPDDHGCGGWTHCGPGCCGACPHCGL